MPILVKHSGNAAPTLWGAYAGGQGRRWAEDARQALNRIFTRDENRKSRDFQARENALSRAEADRARRFSVAEADKARAFSAAQALDQREWQSWQAEKAQWYKERDAAKAREATDAAAVRAHNWQVESADQLFERQQALVDYGIDAKQRAEFNRLSDAYQEAEQSGLYTPEDLAEFKQQVIGKQAGITTPLPKLKKRSQWPEGQDIGQTWTSDDGRFQLGRDKDGKVYKIGETNALPTLKDIAGLYENAVKALTKTDAKGNNVAPDPAEVEAWVDNAVQMHQKYTRRAAPASEDAGQDFSIFLKEAVENKMNPPIPLRTGEGLRKWRGMRETQAQAITDAVTGKKPIVIASDEEYKALPSGALFVGPDKKTRRKP